MSRLSLCGIDQSIDKCFAQALQSYPEIKRVVVGFSGGLDSTVLLHLAARSSLSNKTPLFALHVHHGLSPNADQWAEHCVDVASELSIECVVESVSVESRAGSLEANARAARYQAFQKHLKAGDLLLLGHHADDQVETVIMRLIKGVDSSLLSGIPASRPLGDAHLVRPLLGIHREQLERYALEKRLRWIEDESNQDLDITRNALRHDVLPQLRTKQSDIDDVLLQIAHRQERINEVLMALFEAMAPSMEENVVAGRGVRIDRLNLLSQEAQAMFFRQWILDQRVAQPSERIFKRIWTEVIGARPDSSPMLNWGKAKLRRYGRWLFISQTEPKIDFSSCCVDLKSGTTCIEGLTFSVFSTDKSDTTPLMVHMPSDESVFIKGFSLFASREQLLGKTKKDWCKELGIAPWVQQTILVVEVQGETVALIDAVALKVLATKHASSRLSSSFSLVLSPAGL